MSMPVFRQLFHCFCCFETVSPDTSFWLCNILYLCTPEKPLPGFHINIKNSLFDIYTIILNE